MNRDTIYFKQLQLLIRVLPLVASEQSFALNIRKNFNCYTSSI